MTAAAFADGADYIYRINDDVSALRLDPNPCPCPPPQTHVPVPRRADAQADQNSTAARDSFDSLNLQEIIFLLKEGGMFTNDFTVNQLMKIFTAVNARSSEMEEGDSDQQELDYEEFLQVIGRVCDALIPEASRGGEKYETSLQSWLHFVFLPRYKKLLRDKSQGLGSRTL